MLIQSSFCYQFLMKVRPASRELLESTRSNILKEGSLESYDGTKFVSDDTNSSSFQFDGAEGIDSRFGVSTHKIIDELFDREGSDLPAFSDSYQNKNYKRVGPPPRGIFDDV